MGYGAADRSLLVVKRPKSSGRASHAPPQTVGTPASAVRILTTPEDLQGAVQKASRFDERLSGVLQTRSERYRALQTYVPAVGAAPGQGREIGSTPSGDARASIEVYADISCPFAHVSLRTVGRLRDEIDAGVPILVRAWPLELVNGKPLDPDLTSTHVEELRRDVAPGLFVGFRPEALPSSTLRALALVEAAYENDPWLGERLSFVLRDRLFEEGRPLNDSYLARLATEHAMARSVLDDVTPVEDRLAEGRRRGVRGSPHFFVGTADRFCPLLDITRDSARGLHVEQQLERLRAFLVNGLGGLPFPGRATAQDANSH